MEYGKATTTNQWKKVCQGAIKSSLLLQFQFCFHPENKTETAVIYQGYQYL